jgi:hypothetical protein
MPILRKPSNDAPLGQGDVLKGLRLYATGADWLAVGESAERDKNVDYAMVVSRPCVLYHKPFFVVSAISSVRGNVPENTKTFRQICQFLTELREGAGRPDRFYLGQLPDAGHGRYYAHLDSLHTIIKPSEEELKTFLRSNRIATLDDAFRRDLHLRVLASIADLGFNDYGWLTDQDLRWLVEAGEADLLREKATVAEAKTKVQEIHASGEPKNVKDLKNREENIANSEREIGEFERELENYRRELSSRASIA